MGKIDIEINFDNALGVFRAGQKLSGKILLYFSEPKKSEGLLIRFKVPIYNLSHVYFRYLLINI